MGLFDKKKKEKIRNTVQQSIPILHYYPNGVIETEEGVFSRAYKLEDVNFNLCSEEEQLNIYEAYEHFLNAMPLKTKFQVLIHNRVSDRAALLSQIQFTPQADNLNTYRQEMNSILLKRMSEGRSNLIQDKYLVVSIEDTNEAHALDILEGMDSVVSDRISEITGYSSALPLTLTERLKLMHDIYNQDENAVFENSYDAEGNPVFSLKQVWKQGLSVRDVIAPSGMEFNPTFMQFGDNTYAQSLFLSSLPNKLTTDYISSISELPYSMLISIHYESQDTTEIMRKLKGKLTALNAQIAQAQKKAAESGYSSGIISPDLYREQEDTEELINEMTGSDQKLFTTTLVLTVFSDTKQGLEEATRAISSKTASLSAPLRNLYLQQELGLNASLPLAINKLQLSKLLTTDAASVFIPYTSEELHQKNGCFYGINDVTKNLIMYSRLNGGNYNGLVFGTSGSGKSMLAKSEMINVLMRSDKNRVYVIDPEGEFVNICNEVGGQVINVSSGVGSNAAFINPLDLDLDSADEDDPRSMKSDYIISMIEIMMGRGRQVTPREKSIIDRCVGRIYSGYIKHIEELRKEGRDISCDVNAMPTLTNLHAELLMQPEEEAKNIASVIELYAIGSLNTFAHRTSVNTDAKMVVYNTRNLGTGMKELGLFVALNEVWLKTIENSKKGLWTWFYIDECHTLFRSDSATRFLVEIWKRARKWNGIPTAITQNTEDILRSVETRNILNNTDFVMMLPLKKMDVENLTQLYHLSRTQTEYIRAESYKAKAGHGLLYTGHTTLPFDNEYPSDTALYQLFSTSKDKDKRNRINENKSNYNQSRNGRAIW